MKKAQFARKALNLQEVAGQGQFERPQPYEVAEELVISNERYNQISNNLLKDVPEFAGKGGSKNGVVQAVQVRNEMTGDTFLVNPEGYSYARYVAIQERNDNSSAVTHADLEEGMVHAIRKAVTEIRKRGGDIGIVDVVVRSTIAAKDKEGVIIREYWAELCETADGNWFVEDEGEREIEDTWDYERGE